MERTQYFTICEPIFTFTKMKARPIKRKSIENFALQNAGSRSFFKLWLTFSNMQIGLTRKYF